MLSRLDCGRDSLQNFWHLYCRQLRKTMVCILFATRKVIQVNERHHLSPSYHSKHMQP